MNYISLDNNLLYVLFISVAYILLLVSFIFSETRIQKILVSSVISILTCILYLLYDAPDVALTEGSIGACLSTIILIFFASKISEEKPQKVKLISVLYSLCVCVLIFGVFYEVDKYLPIYGDSNSPIARGVSSYYLENTLDEIKIPAFVAAILASYRGFDTFGETLVVFIAAISVFGILGIKNAKK